MKIKNLLYGYIKKYHDNIDKLNDLADFFNNHFDKIKDIHTELYDELKDDLEKFAFVIDENVITKAIDNLQRKDGKTGKKWEKEDTSTVAKQYGIFTKHSEITPEIWYFALNYTYAVHYHIDRILSEYVELACEEIADRNICIKSKIYHLYK